MMNLKVRFPLKISPSAFQRPSNNPTGDEAPLGAPPPPPAPVGATGTVISNPDDAIVNKMTPSTEVENSELVELREDSTFVQRCLDGSLSQEEVDKLCRAMLSEGKKGHSLENFASQIGLLADEIAILRERHPEVERAIRLSKAHKDKMITDLRLRHATKNPQVLNSLAESKDLVEEWDEKARERAEMEIDKRAEELLLEREILPCEYSTVLYLSGDMTREEQETPLAVRDFSFIGLHTAQQILEGLEPC